MSDTARVRPLDALLPLTEPFENLHSQIIIYNFFIYMEQDNLPERKTFLRQRPRMLAGVWVLGALALLVVMAVTYVLFVNPSPERTSEWQAVFLSNGNVYFGRITRETSKELVLEDIYYLQVSNPLQQDGDPVPKGELQLVKLGNELHGPKDRMIVNKQFVIFTEDLKDDGKVVGAISQHKTGASAAR